MNGANALEVLAVAFSGVNMVVLIAATWKLARWTGIVDTRLTHLEHEHRAALNRRADDRIERA